MEMRFWTKVLPVESGCWEWQAGRNEHGYGLFATRRSGRSRAHRVAYERFVGPIPEGLHVLHTCDNPPCVNPAHLFLGTVKDNSKDMMRKGRNRNQNTGKTVCKHGHALTPDNVYLSKGKRCCRACCLQWQRNKRAA